MDLFKCGCASINDSFIVLQKLYDQLIQTNNINISLDEFKNEIISEKFNIEYIKLVNSRVKISKEIN